MLLEIMKIGNENFPEDQINLYKYDELLLKTSLGNMTLRKRFTWNNLKWLKEDTIIWTHIKLYKYICKRAIKMWSETGQCLLSLFPPSQLYFIKCEMHLLFSTLAYFGHLGASDG